MAVYLWRSLRAMHVLTRWFRKYSPTQPSHAGHAIIYE